MEQTNAFSGLFLAVLSVLTGDDQHAKLSFRDLWGTLSECQRRCFGLSGTGYCGCPLCCDVS